MPKRKREEEPIEEENEDQSDNSEDSENEKKNEEQFTKKVSKEQLEIMEQKIAASPYYYEGHVEFIQALRANSDIVALRKARENMSQYFPLSQEQWLLWLQDEESLATTEEEIAKVKALYERSLQDYQLPKVWEQYCEFALKHFPQEEIEAIFERAVQTAGTHMIDGAALWTLYRNHVQKLNDSTKLRELFRRQLSFPSLSITNVWEEYEKFETDSAEAEKTKLLFIESSMKLEQRMEIESNIIDSIKNKKKSEMLWLKYLELSIEQDPQYLTVQLFERAVQDQCLSERIWNRYLRYLRENNASAQSMLTVYNNACRNCSWSSILWCGFLEYLELCHSDPQWIQNSFQRALASMSGEATDYVAIFLSQCSYMLRKGENDEVIRSTFVNAFEYLVQYFPDGDKSCSVERLWAYAEAHRFKDIERAKEIYRNIISRFPTEASLWFNYVQFMRDIGTNNDGVREIFRQAVKTLDNPRSKRSLAVAWSQFEREQAEGVERVMEAENEVRYAVELMNKEQEEKNAILLAKKTVNKKEKRKQMRKEKKEKKKLVKQTKEAEGDQNMTESEEPVHKEGLQEDIEIQEKQQEKKPKKQKVSKDKKPQKGKNQASIAVPSSTKEQTSTLEPAPQVTEAETEIKQPPTKKRALMKPRALATSGKPLSNADFKKLFEK